MCTSQGPGGPLTRLIVELFRLLRILSRRLTSRMATVAFMLMITPIFLLGIAFAAFATVQMF